MKHVEAMTSDLVTEERGAEFDYGKLKEALDDMTNCAEEFKTKSIEGLPRLLSEFIALANTVKRTFGTLTDQLDEHECSGAMSLVPFGEYESIGNQLRREGFLSAEEVAIVKLADVKAAEDAMKATAKKGAS